MKRCTPVLLILFSSILCSCTAPDKGRRQVSDTAIHTPAESTAASTPGAQRLDAAVTLAAHSVPVVTVAPPPPTALYKMPTPASMGNSESQLTLDQVLDQTVMNHPTLRAREQDVEIARAQLVTAGLLPNPEFVVRPVAPLGGDGPTDILFGFGYTFPTAGKVQHRKGVARVGVDRARLRLSQQTQQVLVGAATAALEVIYLQERVAVQARFQKLASSVVKVQEARFDQGDIAERDLLLAELDAAQVESDRLTLVGELQESRLRLGRAMGLTEPRPVQMTGELDAESVPLVPLEELLAVAREVMPDLGESRAAVRQSERGLALARAVAVPDLQSQLRYREAISEPSDDLGVQIGMALPIFDRNQGGIAESRAQITRAWALLAETEVDSLGDIAALYTQLQAVQARLQFLESEVLPVATRAETAIRRAYEAGDISPVDLSLQLQRLLQIHQDELQLRYLRSQLRMRIEISLGYPLAA